MDDFDNNIIINCIYLSIGFTSVFYFILSQKSHEERLHCVDIKWHTTLSIYTFSFIRGNRERIQLTAHTHSKQTAIQPRQETAQQWASVVSSIVVIFLLNIDRHYNESENNSEVSII